MTTNDVDMVSAVGLSRTVVSSIIFTDSSAIAMISYAVQCVGAGGGGRLKAGSQLDTHMPARE